MKKLIYMLIPLFLFFSCEEEAADDAVVEDATLTGNWSLGSMTPYEDYNCSIADDDDFINIPGITLTGTSVLTDTEITQSLNYSVTGEWWCTVNDGTISSDGSTCSSDGESIAMSEMWNEYMCGFLGEDGGTWDATNETCGVTEQWDPAPYTVSTDGTMLIITESECNCDDSNDCDDATEQECAAIDGAEWEVETDTLEMSITGNTLTLTEKRNNPEDAECDCPDEDSDCDWELDEAACTAAGGDYDNGQECYVWTWTKN